MKTVMSLKKNKICIMYENKKYNPVMSGLRPDITDYYLTKKFFDKIQIFINISFLTKILTFYKNVNIHQNQLQIFQAKKIPKNAKNSIKRILNVAKKFPSFYKNILFFKKLRFGLQIGVPKLFSAKLNQKISILMKNAFFRTKNINFQKNN